MGKPQIRKLLAAPLAAANPGNCRAGSRNGDSWNNKVGPQEIKAGVAEDGRHPVTAESPGRCRICGRGRAGGVELMAPLNPRIYKPQEGVDSPYCCDAIGITSPAVPLPRCGTPHCVQLQGKFIPAPVLGNKSQGRRIRDHRGGRARKEHPLGLDSPHRIPMRW